MSKKVLGTLLAVVMVLSVFSISAFAIRADEYEPADTTYKSNWTISQNGSSATITVTANYALGPIGFKLLNASNFSGVTVVGYYNPYDAQVSPKGEVLILPVSAAEGAGSTPVLAENTTVTITVTCTANNQTAIETEVKDAMNPGGSLIASRLSGKTVENSNIIAGQIANVEGQDYNPDTLPDEEEPTDVTLTGVNGAVVDNARKYVYGIPLETEDPKTCLSTDGYIELVDNNGDGAYGTGDSLNLYTDNSKGSLVDSYKIVMFGDLDGNGACDVTDLGIMKLHATDAELLSEPEFLFAADLADCVENVGVRDVNVSDLGILLLHVTDAELLKSNVRVA